MEINGCNALSKWGGAGVSIFIAISGFLSSYNHLYINELQCPLSIYKRKMKKYGIVHILTLLLSVPLMISIIKTDVVKSFLTLLKI